MTGSGLQSIAPVHPEDRGHRLPRERRSTRGKKSKILLRAPVQARGAKKVQGFVARFIASREEFLEFPHWLLRGLQ
jgi:hypothetical protein